MKPMLRLNRPIFVDGFTVGPVLLAGGRVCPVPSHNPHSETFLRKKEIYKYTETADRLKEADIRLTFNKKNCHEDLCQQNKNLSGNFKNKLKIRSEKSILLKNKSVDLAVNKKYSTLAVGKAVIATTKSEIKTTRTSILATNREETELLSLSRLKLHRKGPAPSVIFAERRWLGQF